MTSSGRSTRGLCTTCSLCNADGQPSATETGSRPPMRERFSQSEGDRPGGKIACGHEIRGHDQLALPSFVIIRRYRRSSSMSRIYAGLPMAILGLVLLSACGTTGTTAQTAPSTSATTAQATPSPATLSCTSSGQASPSWPAPWTRAGSAPPIVSATAAQDTFKLTFDSGTPDFELTPQTSTRFYADTGLGQPIDVAGSAGVRIVLQGFRGDMASYVGPTSFTSQGPLLLQVRSLGGYEGQVSWGAGLSRPGCASVTATGSTLTFHFIPLP